MPEDVYEKLRELLDRHLTGCPPSPEILGILKLLFTEKEAEVALGLGFRPFPAPDIARRAGVNTEDAARLLESLADKGIVFARRKNGEWGYALPPLMPGIFEFPFMKGVHDETIRDLIPLWQKYLPELIRKFGSFSTSFSRIIPIQEEVESEPGILTYEKIYELIDQADVVGIAHCACRELEEKCDAPREACMLFDQTCTFLVERGFARYMTKDEMKRKLREFDEAGLVHQVNNARTGLTFICNCCRCCCGLLRAYTEFGNPDVLASSGFLPVVDADLCTGCGVCEEERCTMGAIELLDKTAVVDPDLCIGCGLCATGCTSEAIKMERKEEPAVPPATNVDMAMAILKDKQKLERFMECMSP